MLRRRVLSSVVSNPGPVGFWTKSENIDIEVTNDGSSNHTWFCPYGDIMVIVHNQWLADADSNFKYMPIQTFNANQQYTLESGSKLSYSISVDDLNEYSTTYSDYSEILLSVLYSGNTYTNGDEIIGTTESGSYKTGTLDDSIIQYPGISGWLVGDYDYSFQSDTEYDYPFRISI